LRKTIGKGEFVETLGTVSHAEAARLARIERLEADRRFDEAEAFLRTAPVEELSESELYHLARAFFFRLEKQASQVPFDPHERAELAAITASDLAAIGEWDGGGIRWRQELRHHLARRAEGGIVEILGERATGRVRRQPVDPLPF
jgi:hypothetical protein